MLAILVTGGAGFIGANFVSDFVRTSEESIINIDILSYAGNRQNLSHIINRSQHVFVQGDLGDTKLVANLLERYKPRAVINFAAETHVDRSIVSPGQFVQTNVVGTFQLLETVKGYWERLSPFLKSKFRFLQISTDEVYGSLKDGSPSFTETCRQEPNSPYSASKAASDHFVRAYYKTYGLPVLTTRCSNNYGPYQYPEKLIPLCIQRALSHDALPIYGDGRQKRDWIYVQDHCRAIQLVLEEGNIGEIYNIGGSSEKTNLEIVSLLCYLLDELRPLTASASISSYQDLVTHVTDRPGHDRRYAVDASKINLQLNWWPTESLESGLRKTVKWYLKNHDKVSRIF